MTRGPSQNPIDPIAAGDLRLDAPAFHRNCAPIWAELSGYLKDKQGRTPLDVAMGVGGRGRGGEPPAARRAAADLLRQLATRPAVP